MNPRTTHNEKFPNPHVYAARLVPEILQITGDVNRVVDVGGGIGAWCKAFKENGATQVLCIDSPEIKPFELLIDEKEFWKWDLSSSFPDPIQCDLAICLEVAEHLPQEMGPRLVDFLTHSSEIVVFSASIPGQPGRGHINERPVVYWKQKFEEYGFRQWDVIRPQILFEADVPYWYRQNMFIYANDNWRERLKGLSCRYPGIPEDFELVHERVLNIYRAAPAKAGLRTLIREFPRALQSTLYKRMLRKNGRDAS